MKIFIDRMAVVISMTIDAVNILVFAPPHIALRICGLRGLLSVKEGAIEMRPYADILKSIR